MESFGDQDVNINRINENRIRKIAQLEQRNDKKDNNPSSSNLKLEENDLDELIKAVKLDLENNKTDQEKIDKLQNYLVFSSAHHRSRAIQSLLEEVRKFKLAQKPVKKFTGFSFKKTNVSPKKEKKEVSAKADLPENVGIEIAGSVANSFTNLMNKNDVIVCNSMEDINLKDIENCRLEFKFEPSVIHMRNIKNSTFIFLKCDRSILMHDCENVHIFVSAQQIRVHTSKNIHLHVATRGAVILEESTGIFMYGYRLKYKNGENVQFEDNETWKTPRDFDWLAQTQSPNWELLPEDKWTTETLSF